jgi:hypothetical protein
MAFTVEDGTGLSAANSYVSTAELATHHADRGNDISGFANTDRETALVRATDYVDKRFGHRFRGWRQSKSQALEWPRLSAFDNDEFLLSDVDDIPRNLKRAVSEYAFIALQISLLPIPARPYAVLDPATGIVSVTAQTSLLREKNVVGPIEEEKWFQEARSLKVGEGDSLSGNLNLPEYPAADEWLRELIKPPFATQIRRA